MDNTVRVQVSVAAPTSPQGESRNSSPSFRRAVCICTLRLLYASRKCKTFVRSSFFASLQNYRSLTHFHSAGAARAAVLQGESRNSSPSFRRAVCICTLRLLYASRKCKRFIRSSFFASLQNCRSLTTRPSFTRYSVNPRIRMGQSKGEEKKRSIRSAFLFCCFDAFTSWRCTRKAP